MIRAYNACTPGTRNRSISTFEELTVRRDNSEAGKVRKFTIKPTKKLTTSIPRATSRNNRGIMTSGHRGGGHKQNYRMIDFRRSKRDTPALVQTVEYDPNRNARICLVSYQNGDKAYIIHPEGLQVGEQIVASEQASSTVGNCLSLNYAPLGVELHNVELKNGKGGQIARSAGTFAQIVAKEGSYVTLRMPSGELRFVRNSCWATVGRVGNAEHSQIVLGKAGRNRWLGRRPHVRGSVKNPVDHPHGGGEGKCPIGHDSPRTPWGKPALGKKTRKTKKYSDCLMVK